MFNWFKKPKWKELEKEFIQGQARRECITFEHGGYSSKVYYLTNPLDDSTGDTYICIHGTAGTSLSFLSLIPHFPKDSRFYILDLPGFGKSHTTCEYPDTVYYIECIRQWMRILGITQARFIAHSFGTFLTVHFANVYPEQVKSLTLIAPTGLLPVLSYNGLLWAILFKLRFPYIIKYIRWMLWILYSMKLFHTYTAYYISCYGDRKTIMASHLISFICVEWKKYYIQGYWNEPILDKLLRLPIPISLIYGELDTLVPSHHGLVIRGLRSDITVDVIKNEGHNPISRVPRLIIERSIRNNIPENPISVLSIKKIQKILSHPERYASYFSFHHTWLSIHRLYSDLLIN